MPTIWKTVDLCYSCLGEIRAEDPFFPVWVPQAREGRGEQRRRCPGCVLGKATVESEIWHLTCNNADCLEYRQSSDRWEIARIGGSPKVKCTSCGAYLAWWLSKEGED